MKITLGLLALFGIADGVLTNLLIERGIAHEGNPLLKTLAGTPGLILLKVGGIALASIILWDIYRFHPRLGRVATSVFAVLYGFIACWNAGLLLLG